MRPRNRVKKTSWSVAANGRSAVVAARNPGGAVHRFKRLFKMPSRKGEAQAFQGDGRGGWKGVSVARTFRKLHPFFQKPCPPSSV